MAVEEGQRRRKETPCEALRGLDLPLLGVYELDLAHCY